MRIIRSIILAMTLMSAAAHGGEQVKRSANDASIGQVKSPQEVVAGFDQRVDQMFRAEAGKPLVRAAKRKPLKPGRGNYVRHYSWSMMEFAARCLYLGEMEDEANAALAENAQHYLDNQKDINDRDSFHWHAEMVLRLIEMYGSQGSKHPGRITEETEALVLKPIWIYARKISTLAKAEFEKSQTWHVYGSENHHAMIFTLCWHFAKLAKDQPEYRGLKYDDGATAAEHYHAWSDYFVVYCRERARKGMFVEMMNDGYNSVLIKGIYNFFDFGEPQVRRSAGLLLDLYWAYWAQEQIDGVQGGGRSRIYFMSGLKYHAGGEGAHIPWFYFGMGEPAKIICPSLNAALSDYRPPAVVADIALDVAGRGRYEVRQRPLGLATAGGMRPYKLKTDAGGILRYSYCDPAFIIGTPMTEARPLKDWTNISSQNRWQGVIFAGENDARIVPIVRPANNMVTLNGQWSVQSKASLITQKLKHHKGAAEMIVWMSEEGLSSPLEEDGIVFVEAKGAYAAIRVVKGNFKWSRQIYTYESKDGNTYTSPQGMTMVLDQEYSPVILEIMAKSDVRNFEEFKAKVKACELKMDGELVKYKTIYGDRLTFDSSYETVPLINGKPVNYAPTKAFESPFLNADFNSGVVTISKGKRKKVLDFTKRSENTAKEKTVKIGLIGDSTVAVQSGWGPAFASRFNDKAKILNYAKNGATLQALSRKLDALVELKPDYVLIQFGHNDQKRYDTKVYGDLLKSYVARIIKAGGQPIIVSSVTRRSFDANSNIVSIIVKNEKYTYKANLTAYAQAAHAVAREMKVPFIDLHTISIAHHNKIGPKASMTYNFKEGDRTHFNEKGGQAITDLILGELKKVAPELTACLNGTQQAFKQASAGNWQDVFSDEGTGDWKENWFLDGEVGRVSTGTDGMSLTAGPQFKDDSHHMVLWTKDSFKGDLKIEYEYTRLDSETRCVNILYIQATGSGKEPYAADISKWNDLRKVPSMKTYYNHMNTYHISYSANPGTSEQYIRGRRYMPNRTGLKGTNLKPDYYPKGLFASGVPHKITVIKKDRDIFMRIKNPEQVYYCRMSNTNLPIVTEGRIGLRHMFTRSARYKNIRISTPSK
jgi:lysophospholipase L1-like esterase